MVDGRKQVTRILAYTRSTLCIEHCFTDFKFKPLIYQFRFLATVLLVIFLKTMYNKTIIRFGFCYILDNQGLTKCYQPWPLACSD